MRRLGAALTLGAALVFAGCEDVVVPDGARGTYELVEVNGAALPALMFEGETEFGYVVATATSGSLTLRESTFTQRIVVDLVLEGTPFPGDEILNSGDYSVSGQILNFDPEVAGRPSFTGTLQGGVLATTEHDPEFGDLDLTWQR